MSVKLSKYKTKKKHNRDKKTKKKQHIHILNGGMKTLKPKKIYKAPVKHSRTHFSPGDEQETNPQAQQSQSPSQKKNKTRSSLVRAGRTAVCRVSERVSHRKIVFPFVFPFVAKTKKKISVYSFCSRIASPRHQSPT